jgi:hypothetical protein
MLKGVILSDRIKVPSQRQITDAGQMIVPCAFARTGTQLYTAKQLGIVDKEANEVVEVYRDEVDVFDEDSVASFRSAPVTLGHPKNEDGQPIQVTADNAKELQVGMLEGKAFRDEDTLAGVIVLSNKEAIDALENGTQELSAGYICDIAEVEGKFYQRNIRANHIAIVDKGRAGSSCRISDEADQVIEGLEESAKQDITGSITEVVDSNFLTVFAKHIADESVAKQLLVDKLKEVDEKLVELTDEISKANEAIEAKDKEIEEGKIKLEDAIAASNENVIERCEVIDKARYIADLKDFGDKTVAEIKKLVVADQLPNLSLEGKDEQYVSARFDILMEEAEKETPMSQVLRDHANNQVVTKHEDPVAVARQNMINRNKGK